VVIDFHGYYDTGSNQEEESGVKAIADASNFIAVWQVKPLNFDRMRVSPTIAHSRPLVCW
jgi:poly(3-hydroxybutyrate) depolymerase